MLLLARKSNDPSAPSTAAELRHEQCVQPSAGPPAIRVILELIQVMELIEKEVIEIVKTELVQYQNY